MTEMRRTAVARVAGKATTAGEGCAAGVFADDQWSTGETPILLCRWTLESTEWSALDIHPTLRGDRGAGHCHTSFSWRDGAFQPVAATAAVSLLSSDAASRAARPWQ